MTRTPEIRSRLPHVGTTIFSTMSALAQQHGAVNLGQGFPDFDCDPALVDAVHQAMKAGHNQYPLMTGVPARRVGWMCRCGERLPGEPGAVACASCGARYLVHGESCEEAA